MFTSLKELELYKEELQTKPALLAVNKMDLPEAQDKFHELMNQLQNPKGKAVHSFNPSIINTYYVQRKLNILSLEKKTDSSDLEKPCVFEETTHYLITFKSHCKCNKLSGLRISYTQ